MPRPVSRPGSWVVTAATGAEGATSVSMITSLRRGPAKCKIPADHSRRVIASGRRRDVPSGGGKGTLAKTHRFEGPLSVVEGLAEIVGGLVVDPQRGEAEVVLGVGQDPRERSS